MERLYLKGIVNLLSEGDKEIKQDFYLVEKTNHSTTYGIKIVKNKGNYYIEENSGPISTSKRFVEELLHTFIDKKISAISLIEIIDDIISEKLWKKDYHL